ncbi:hypothetical protein OAM04_02340 [bacterium]|nr:hypothetical protein [bacterium]
MKTICLSIICAVSATTFLTACGGDSEGNGNAAPQPSAEAHDGSFNIFVHKTGIPPVTMKVKESTPHTEVHAFAAEKLGLAPATFDLHVAGKKIEGTIGDLGFRDPGPGSNDPVGNIKVKLK